ncbi:MAG: 23S rRNA (uracil(1939)-C(5))-methyltransferase RlmD [Prevotellaceae bacterium]|nr:23S rRNA (uracil(1939)-C(5))-methyltransferase RlmD [Prevotellaceae bacterium]
MSKKSAKKTNTLFENVKIVDVAAEGKAIARVNDIVIFVSYAIPGDVVDIQITRKQKRYFEGLVVRTLHEAENAGKPFCEHFGECGGCKWQRLPYQSQLDYKRKQVIDQFTRIGLIENPNVKATLASEKTLYYRNKLEFTFSDKRWITRKEIENNAELDNPNALGFHIPERFDKVLDIKKCYLQPEPSNAIRFTVKTFAVENNYDFFDLKEKKGFLRNLIIRTASSGEIMVIVVFSKEDEKKRIKLLDYLLDNFSQITSLQYVINSKPNDSHADQEMIVYAGKPYITEMMEDLQFRLGAKSFYQTNTEQAYQLYSIAREYAQLTGKETVYDLYTGTGTIANFLARNAAKVIGVEYIKEAIDDARINSEINNITNTTFYVGDMKDILTKDFIRENGKADVVILDPPRAGIHPDVVKTLLAVSPQRIVYISCNPATQARDIAALGQSYKLLNCWPVDMFPHTHHIENIALLEKV